MQSLQERRYWISEN